jgi:hypothetical protein
MNCFQPIKKYIVLLILLMNSAWAISQVNVAKGKSISSTFGGGPDLVDGDLVTPAFAGSGFYDDNGNEMSGDIIIDFGGNCYINSMTLYKNLGLDHLTVYYYKDNNWVLLKSVQYIADGDIAFTFPEVLTTKIKMVVLDIDNEIECWISEIEVYGRTYNAIITDFANIGTIFTNKILIGKTTQTNTSYLLDIAGKMRADEVKVNTSGADFVFDKNYILSPLSEVECFIKQNKHLPDIAPAAEMQTNGISIGDMQAKLLQKVEELTLYSIAQEKKNAALKQQLAEQKAQYDILMKKVEFLVKIVETK